MANRQFSQSAEQMAYWQKQRKRRRNRNRKSVLANLHSNKLWRNEYFLPLPGGEQYSSKAMRVWVTRPIFHKFRASQLVDQCF